MFPAAPGRLSMTNCCPSASESPGANNRLVKSTDEPGGKGATRRTGRAGYGCAQSARELKPHRTANPTNRDESRFIIKCRVSDGEGISFSPGRKGFTGNLVTCILTPAPRL